MMAIVTNAAVIFITGFVSMLVAVAFVGSIVMVTEHALLFVDMIHCM